MKVYNPKNIKFHDKLTEKRHKVFIFKILFFIGLAVTAVGLIFYLLFFSGGLDIREVTINGLEKADKDKFNEILDKRLNSKLWNYVEYQRNTLFFDPDSFKAEILTVVPEIKNISINKKPPHTLNINVTERETAGVWCFVAGSVEPTANCRYFDEDGVIWGEAALSSGFLILNVEDMRQNRQKRLDKNLLDNLLFISKYLKETNIFVNKFVIPENFIGDFRAVTSKNYDLLFSLDSDIDGQLEVLKIFLAEKQNTSPPAGEFKPRYIDLRINSRIYYK